MDLSALDYTDILDIKLSVLSDMHKNIIAQSNAIDIKDDKLIKKLLKRQKKYYDNFNEVSQAAGMLGEAQKNEEALRLEQSIQVLLKEVCNNIQINIEKASRLKEEISISIKHIKLGENALKNGYFKSLPQQYGYFIDKKVGAAQRMNKKF